MLLDIGWDCPIFANSWKYDSARHLYQGRTREPLTTRGLSSGFFDSLARAYLEPGVSSVPQINKGIQEIFFVADGTGTLVTDDGEHPIREGNGIYVPTGVEHTFVNDGDIPLELIIVVELVPEGTEVESSTALISKLQGE